MNITPQQWNTVQTRLQALENYKTKASGEIAQLQKTNAALCKIIKFLYPRVMFTVDPLVTDIQPAIDTLVQGLP